MNFLAPIGLAGLAALAPIIALYFLKMRREKRAVPSTLLWKQVIQDLHVNAPFQRLKYSLLLLLQLVLVALMAFALARPFLSLNAQESKRIVLLVDTSASMATRDAGSRKNQSRLEAAIADAVVKIDDLGSRGEMRIIAFDTEVRSLTPFTSNKSQLKTALHKLAPRDLPTRVEEVFETAMALAEERTNSEIVVLSDGCFNTVTMQQLFGEEFRKRQEGGGNVTLNTENMADLMSNLDRFSFVNYGQIESDNVGITSINARTRILRRRADSGKMEDVLQTQVFVMVENFASEDKDVVLTLSAENSKPFSKSFTLKARPRGTESLNDETAAGHTVDAARKQEIFEMDDMAGLVTARITAPSDSFPLDNQAQVVVGNAEGTKVLLVTKGNYFLEKVFVVMAGIEVSKMTPEAFDREFKIRGPLLARDYDTIVFEDYAPPRWDDGGAVFLGSVPPLAGFKNTEADRKFPDVIDWDVGHPVMRYVNFSNIQVAKSQTWELPKAAKTLVDANGGPLIVAFESDRVNAVGVAFQVLDSDWPYRSSLPLFLRNALAWTSEVSPRRRSSANKTGEALTVPPHESGATAQLLRPDGAKTEVKLSPRSKQFVPDIEKVGLYTLQGIPGEKPEGLVYAVNLADARESDNAAQPKVRVGDKTFDANRAAIEAKQEIWPTLIMVAMGLLMLEWIVYHRRVGM